MPLRPPPSTRGCRRRAPASTSGRASLRPRAHAQVINPTAGVILNWNNKPARGYVGRRRRVDVRLRAARRPAAGRASRAGQKHTLASVVGAMNRAATQDLRAVRVWPVVRASSRAGRGAGARGSGRARLDAWLAPGAAGSTRDLDGKVDAPGAAVLDAAGPRLADAVLAPVLDAELRARARAARPERPGARADGSSAYSGWWYATSRRTCARCSAARFRARSTRGSAAPATSRRARRRSGRRSTRRRRRSRRRRGPTRPRGARTRRRSGSGSRPGSCPHDALDEPADVPAGDLVRDASDLSACPRSRRLDVTRRRSS